MNGHLGLVALSTFTKQPLKKTFTKSCHKKKHLQNRGTMPAFILWMDHAYPSYIRFIFTLKNWFLELDERIQKGKTWIKQEKYGMQVFSGHLSREYFKCTRSFIQIWPYPCNTNGPWQTLPTSSIEAVAVQASQICEPAKVSDPHNTYKDNTDHDLCR
jgi:hypothetical protein